MSEESRGRLGNNPMPSRVIFFTGFYYGPLIAYVPLLLVQSAAPLLPTGLGPLATTVVLVLIPFVFLSFAGLFSFLVAFNVAYFRRHPWIVPYLGWNVMLVSVQYLSLLSEFQKVGYANEIPSIQIFSSGALGLALRFTATEQVFVIPWMIICHLGTRSFSPSLFDTPEGSNASRAAASLGVAMPPILGLWAIGATIFALNRHEASSLPVGPKEAFNAIYLSDEVLETPDGSRERLALYFFEKPMHVYLKRIRYRPGGLRNTSDKALSLAEMNSLPFGHYLMSNGIVRFSLTNRGESNGLETDFDFRGRYQTSPSLMELEWCHSGCTTEVRGVFHASHSGKLLE